jgi:hypothetical protein
MCMRWGTVCAECNANQCLCLFMLFCSGAAVCRIALPQPSDSDWDKPKPRHPIVGPASYPKSQPDVISAPGLFRKMDPEALFFAFYYQPDTYQQYLAAQVGGGIIVLLGHYGTYVMVGVGCCSGAGSMCACRVCVGRARCDREVSCQSN